MYRSVVLSCWFICLNLTPGILRQSLAQDTGALIRSLPSVAPHENELTQIQALVDVGQHTEALERIDMLLQRSPDMVQARFLKGVALAERGQVNKAIVEFQFLMTKYPFLPEPYNNLAVLYAQQEQYDQARETLLKALETHTSYATAYQNLSHIYAMMAGAAYDKALGLNAEEKQSPDLQLLGDLHSTKFIHTEETILAATEVPMDRADQPSATDVGSEQQVGTRPSDRLAQTTTNLESAIESASPPVNTSIKDVDQARIATLVESWRSAWADQNADAYLSFYGSTFKFSTRYKTHSAWEKSRRGTLARASFIEVVTQDLDINMEGDDRAQVTFRQMYRSDRFQDLVRKTLTLQKVDTAWRIVQETSVEI
jgi:tetratricopeptide (TPR) repeat protein